MENGDKDNLLSIKCRLGVGPKREKGMQVGTCAITHLFHSLPSFCFSFGFFNTKHKMLGMVWLGINPCGGTSASIFHLFLSLSLIIGMKMGFSSAEKKRPSFPMKLASCSLTWSPSQPSLLFLL